ncbi:MAG TPA: 50S ribosomal protein L9 [Candidatus Eremiobacteraeota bacterium]|nr:MAG: 50S ribosomal protein L9 [bacterium ADurb.Bin363]HPZ07168.1 50S ribosomal protein L9 [Candidatus Eremiobacteraeota bacterium]
MKVILVEDVSKLGKLGDIVKVARGYARNYLIPRNIALEATEGNIRHMEEKKKVHAKRARKRIQEAVKLVSKLEGIKLVIRARVGEEGKLYGSITSKDIAEKLLSDHGIEVDRRKIVLDEPIKIVGHYNVPIVYHNEARSTILLEVQELIEDTVQS